ncbi:toprim domain-containing protein [Flavobacterium macacae]|uniref:DNA primase n=1 Tax=Flavobacterium macacae TaxID=2488993 RepID=A0A3P3W8U5_9FLAO|nr:toprim domain-containing protein [Flavobacterium macacae]RRJ90767.1 DNA primase [Flavobacterium macacae]
MEDPQSPFTIQDARSVDMVGYLQSIGFEPVRIRGANHWYLSPLRTENDPSFKVDQRLNLWYDHGLGKGGTLIDFGMLYHGCTLREMLHLLSGNGVEPKGVFRQPSRTENDDAGIKVSSAHPIRSPSLLRYLEQRRIPQDIAAEFCVEVRYELNQKTYYGIGFRNDMGGYEIRNPYFKSGSSPKAISTVENGSDSVSVFEGFMDFLSFRAMFRGKPESNCDYLVLNSVSFFEKARPFMEKHASIRLYLDLDQSGKAHTLRALSLCSKYTDASAAYKGYKDLNEYWARDGDQRKKNIGRRI